MIDLAHRTADGGKAGLLPERRAHALLHDAKLALGNADFIAPAAARHHRRRALGRAPEGDEIVAHPAQRAHHQEVEAEEYQPGGDRRQHQRELENAARIIEHFGHHRPFVKKDIDRSSVAVPGRRADHADDALAAARHGAEGRRMSFHGVSLAITKMAPMA